MNMPSTPTAKSAALQGAVPLNPTVRPTSYVKSKSQASGRAEPPHYNSGKKTQPAYIDAWGNAIWTGNQQYRRAQAKALGANYKELDKNLTVA